MSDWCIVLPSGSSVLRLLDSLTEASFDVWTPVEYRSLPGKTEKTERHAMLPWFLFARADRIIDLHDLVRSPVQIYRVWDAEKRKMVVKGHPRFRLFRNDDGYPLLPERDLAHLREAELKRKPRGKVKVFSVGDLVKLTEGAYAGLRGEVIATKGKKATVAFTDAAFIRDAQIPMWLLLDDNPIVHVSNAITEQAPVARAA